MISLRSKKLFLQPSFHFSIFERILPKDSLPAKLMSEFYLICKEGSKETYNDLKYLYSISKVPEHQLSFIEFRNKRLIKNDILKLIPFTFFVFVPFSLLLLQPYLYLFPNSIPKRYLKYFLDKRKRKFLEKKRQKALKESAFEGDWRHLDSQELTRVADLLKMEYFSLTYGVSRIFHAVIKTPFFIANVIFWLLKSPKRLEYQHWIFDYQLKLNYFPFEPIKRKVLIIQIRRYLGVLWKEDKKLAETEEEKLERIGDDDSLIVQYLDERGIRKYLTTDWKVELKEWRKRIRNHRKNEDFITEVWENLKDMRVQYFLHEK